MDTTELIAILADVAGTLRGARAAGLPAPLTCAGGHNARRFVPWGYGFVCCACGRRALPADELHQLLVRALRTPVQIQTEEKAA